MTEWHNGDGLFQGMRLEELNEPQGVTKFVQNTQEPFTITESTFKYGNMVGLSREVSATEVKLTLYDTNQECIGQITWDENFDEIDR